MPCNCGAPAQYVATRPDGSTHTYATASEAAADTRRNGGTYKKL